MPGLLRRVVAGHPRAFAALAAALLAWAVLAYLPPGKTPDWPGQTQAILAWDVGALTFLASTLRLFAARGPGRMAEDAEAQQEGQWAVFWVMLLGTMASFAALSYEFSGLKDLPALERGLRVALVAATLLLSWLSRTRCSRSPTRTSGMNATTRARSGGAWRSLGKTGRITWISCTSPRASA